MRLPRPRLRLDSLRSKIRLIFSIAILLLLLLFSALLQSTTGRAMQELQMQERANIHYLYLYYLKYGKIDKDYLASQNIRIVDAGSKNFQMQRLREAANRKKKFDVVNVNFHRYILINNDRFKLILENLNRPRFPVELFVAFAGAFALLVILYFWIIRSIRPLSELKEKILRFSQGDLEIHCHSNRHDEIAEVANAFDRAVQTIRDLIQSRQLLLRAIMHELKTPIAKGRFLSEMVDDPKKKARFNAIFARLNLLIDEFAKVEQISSKNFRADLRPYKVSDLVEASIDLLMLENSQKHLHVVTKEDRTVLADFELLTLAIKNLLDNAIKYSPDHRADVLIDGRRLVLSNRGKKLPGDFEEYFKPFHRSTGGLGLGLYIIKSILDIHTMKLEYRYENGVNYFTILFTEKS
ncbi:ArsS family sensor histidine kinase [Nitratifractor sp.]|uniref:ArsS family sensor histidine kinase n=1 Tax=Nitratifractor sp. TaxID=2268144 RepID=UPI0025CD0145|nr:ArsS family sensor histidine kinase [Nitratifractor sp.]